MLEFAIIIYVTYLMGGRDDRQENVTSAVCDRAGTGLAAKKHWRPVCQRVPAGSDPAKGLRRYGKTDEANAELPSLEVYYKGCRVRQESSQLVVRRAVQTAQGMLHFTDAPNGPAAGDSAVVVSLCGD
jgi:hypothetical protein